MPVIHISDFSITEDAIPGFKIRDLYVRNPDSPDPLEGYTFTFNDPRFSYDYGDRDLVLDSEFNFEALTSKSFTLQITAEKGSGEGKETLTSTITITVVDIEEAPKNLTMSGGVVGEDAAAGAVVATLNAIDEDAGDQEALSYDFVTDASGETVTTDSLFEIVGNQIKLKSQPGDAKAGTYTFWVRAFDDNSAGTEKDKLAVKQITLTIADVVKDPGEPVNTVNGDPRTTVSTARPAWTASLAAPGTTSFTAMPGTTP
jgi:hypothetical protein